MLNETDAILDAYWNGDITRPQAIEALVACGLYRHEAITKTADVWRAICFRDYGVR